ncbi:18066_t:CDS:1, partial [Entrophospora sp. SA101]
GKQKFRDGIKSDGSKQLMHLPDGTPKGIKKILEEETYGFQD